MADTAPLHALDVGSQIAQTYEVVRLLGRGGFGEVWLARHLRLPGKQVAIKVLHTRPGGLSDNTLARFRREAEVATRIGHPNIVEVHDFNMLPSGAPYLVLEFLQGESLASRLRFGAMPVDEVLLLIRQIGSALDASHHLGVIHRDLKPDNIFLVPTPMGTQVKVLDFGISKIIDSDSVQTADQALVGTPQYMSPEQATGHNSEVGPQTDVFALGSIAYEMLTGAPPFTADSIAKVVFRIAYEPHVPLRQVKPGLPERVYEAVDRALEKDKAKRFATIADFVAALTGQPVPRTLPPQSRDDSEPSGVARPGMATPESLGLAQTAARTPSVPPAAPAPAPAPVPAPPASPSAVTSAPGTSPLVFVALGLALLAVGGAAFVALRAPPAPPPAPVPPPPPVAAVVATPPPPPPPAPAVEAEPAQPPPTSAAAAPVRPRASKKLPDEDVAALTEMETRLADSAPLRRVQQLLRLVTTDAGLQRAYVIAGTAGCKERDLAAAAGYLHRLEERAERQRLIAECKKVGMELTE